MHDSSFFFFLTLFFLSFFYIYDNYKRLLNVNISWFHLLSILTKPPRIFKTVIIIQNFHWQVLPHEGKWNLRFFAPGYPIVTLSVEFPLCYTALFWIITSVTPWTKMQRFKILKMELIYMANSRSVLFSQKSLSKNGSGC